MISKVPQGLSHRASCTCLGFRAWCCCVAWCSASNCCHILRGFKTKKIANRLSPIKNIQNASTTLNMIMYHTIHPLNTGPEKKKKTPLKVTNPTIIPIGWVSWLVQIRDLFRWNGFGHLDVVGECWIRGDSQTPLKFWFSANAVLGNFTCTYSLNRDWYILLHTWTTF